MREESQLIRAIGRWTLVALVLNSIVGNGMFGLPALAGLARAPDLGRGHANLFVLYLAEFSGDSRREREIVVPGGWRAIGLTACLDAVFLRLQGQH